jgi:hypothetical protein
MKYSFNSASIYEKIIEPFFRNVNNTKLWKVLSSGFQYVLDDMSQNFFPQKVKEANYNSCKLAFEWFLNDRFNIPGNPLRIYITNTNNKDNTFFIYNTDEYQGLPTYFLENTSTLPLVLQYDDGCVFVWDPNYQWGYGDVVGVIDPKDLSVAMYQCINYQPSNDLNDTASWFPVNYVYNYAYGLEPSPYDDVNFITDFIVNVPANQFAGDGENQINKFVNDIRLYNMYYAVVAYA